MLVIDEGSASFLSGSMVELIKADGSALAAQSAWDGASTPAVENRFVIRFTLVFGPSIAGERGYIDDSAFIGGITSQSDIYSAFSMSDFLSQNEL